MNAKHDENMVIEGISAETMPEILNFVYLARLELNEDNILQLLEAFLFLLIQGKLLQTQ